MPPRSGPRLVSRRFMHAQIRDSIGAGIEPDLLDRIEADLNARFDTHLPTLREAHEREKEVRTFHAIHEFRPLLRAEHLEVPQ